MMNTTHAPLMTLRYGVLAGRRRTAAPTAVPAAAVSLQERVRALDSAVAAALSTGALLESHTATVAVLRYPTSRLNHSGRLLVTAMRLGLGLFSRAAAEQAPRVLLTVDERGNISRWSLPR